MQATIENNVKENVTEKINYLLSAADTSTKNDVENSIVALGAKAVNTLIDKIGTLKGLQRGIVAMSLIRIGESAVAPLKAYAMEHNENQWIADYLLSEI